MRSILGTASCLLLAAILSVPAHAKRDKRDAGDDDVVRAASEFAGARTAPGIVLPGAYGAAFASLQALPATSASWTEVTNRPYNSDDLRYRDPFASNSTGGSGFVAGRMTGLAVGAGYLYAGGADGGVFRSADGGKSWSPMTDGLPTLSVGDLKLAPDGSLWLATGEGHTGATSYVGSGVYRVAHPQADLFTTASRVGGSELESTTIGKLRFDSQGSVYAASSRGLWKHASAKTTGAWSRVLVPVPGATGPYDNICNDVAIDPKSGGSTIIANCAWRGGAAYNGFYVSIDSGATFAKVNPLGALNPQDVGRATFAYSNDGSALYVLLESIVKYTNNNNTALSGVYVSPGGDVSGPWNKIADSASIGSSGSALKNSPGYKPGIQVWYNQFLGVDPADAQHVVVGMEEVYETIDGGNHWNTIGPYWNFDFACWSSDPAQNTCPMAPHSDQHSVAMADGYLYIGNDGGIYRRGLRGPVNIDGHGTDWVSLNASLRTLQYYSVGVGKVPGGVAVSGGLQDNGGSLLLPEDLLPGGTMGAPFGGDGGDVLVDPDNGCKIVQEYVFLTVEVTQNCGRSDGVVRSVRDIAPVDPNPRFIAPFLADKGNKNHWVAGGQVVWTYKKGFAITSGAAWLGEFALGALPSATALASQNDVIYAAWCGGCNPESFTRGLATNAGGAWHQVSLGANVPNRYIAGLAIDPLDASGRTVYMAVNGFSRRFVEGPGAGVGHLYKSTDAGATWSDVSGNLPDVPANAVVVRNGKIILSTDLGVVVSSDGGA